MSKTFASGFVIPDPRDEPETYEQSLARWNRVMGMWSDCVRCPRCGAMREAEDEHCQLCEAEEES